MKKYVLTSAQMGAEVNKSFLNSLLNYCNKNKAKLMIIPLMGKGKLKEDFASEIEDYVLYINQTYKLNSNVEINTISINPTNVCPLTGLKRLAKVTTIFGSPKMALEVVPTANEKMAKAMMTTGAITYPHYSNSKTGMLSTDDHKYGAIIVEILNDHYFNFRQLNSNDKGEITDLGIRYSANKSFKTEVEAIVLGDIHVGAICPKTQKATELMIKELKPKQLVLHDLNDYYSVNHHHDFDLVRRAIKAMNNRDDLKDELERVAEYLVYLKHVSNDAQLVVVASNHHDFVDKYLKQGVFLRDPKNLKISLNLMLAMLEGMDPTEAYIKEMSSLKDQLQDVVFLSRDNDYKIAGIQCGAHGDLGANGAKGNVFSHGIGAGNCVIAHTHSPRIHYGVYQVGTSTLLKLEYNQGGFSSWLNTHCVIYKDSVRQLLNIIEGKYK